MSTSTPPVSPIGDMPILPPSRGPGALRVALRSLSHRNYRLFFFGQLVSVIGLWMQQIAQAWLVYRLTRDPLLLGSVAFTAQLPVFMFATVGGAVADRLDRRKLLIGTQSSAALLSAVLAVLTLTGQIHVWHVFVLAGLSGLVNAFDIPIRQAFVVQMVGKRDLPNAIALNSAMFNGARVLGPAAGGLLVARLGEGWCFACNSISFLAVIASLAVMRIQARPIAPAKQSAGREFVQGISYARTTPPIFAVLVLLGLVSFAGMPYMVLMPVFADKILHLGPRGLGLLMGTAGVGALAGAFTLALQTKVYQLIGWAGLCAAGFGFALLAFSQTTSVWLCSVLLFGIGYCMIVQAASSNTLIQSIVPDRLRGRVMALYSMMFMGMGPCGSLVAGALASRIGVPDTLAINAMVCVLGAVWFGVKLKGLRVQTEILLTQAAQRRE